MMQNQSTVARAERKQTGLSRWTGLLFILVGGALFVSYLFNFRLENWWALFIMMPALGLFAASRAIPRCENGRFSMAARFFLASGLMVLVVAVMFLINLDWSVWWPLMIVTPGLSLLVLIGKNHSNASVNAWIGFFRWVSVTVISLGAVFLIHTMGIVNLNVFEQFHWWGVFIAFPAVGALLQAVRLYSRLGRMDATVISLLLIALFTSITAAVELLSITWTSYFGITAVSLIGSGMILLWHGLWRTNK